MNNQSIVWNMAGWIFGIVVVAIGLVNTFWGNDPLLGVMIQFLSFVYFPPVDEIFKEMTGFSIHKVIKIALGVLILWVSLGVGELFDKIDLMMNDFR